MYLSDYFHYYLDVNYFEFFWYISLFHPDSLFTNFISKRTSLYLKMYKKKSHISDFFLFVLIVKFLKF